MLVREPSKRSHLANPQRKEDMFDVDFGGEPAPDRRSAMDQFWFGALARFDDYIARELAASLPGA
jgi:hypothetical protein